MINVPIFIYEELDKKMYFEKLIHKFLKINSGKPMPEDEDAYPKGDEDFFWMLLFNLKKRFNYHGILIDFEDNFRHALMLHRDIINILYEAYQNPLTFDDYVYKHLSSQVSNNSPIQNNLIEDLKKALSVVSKEQNLSESVSFGKWSTIQRMASSKVNNYFESVLDSMQDGFTQTTPAHWLEEM